MKPETPELNKDETVFILDEEAWQEFNRLLDAPPCPLPELKKLLASKPVWDLGAE